MNELSTMDRRRFLRNALGASAGLVVAPAAFTALSAGPAAATTTAATDPLLPFVDHYTTNVSANLTAASNAAVDILSGMAKLWQTGTAWDNGTVLAPPSCAPTCVTARTSPAPERRRRPRTRSSTTARTRATA